jgi:hypothetical protein
MSTTEHDTALERLAAMVPKPFREGFDRLARAGTSLQLERFARRVRDQLPPVVIQHRIDALERHVDRRFKEMDAKLEQVLRHLESRAA